MGHLLVGSMVGLMVTFSTRAYATHCLTLVCCTQSPCPYSRPLLTRISAGDSCKGLAQSLWGLWVLLHTRFCLSPPSVSGGYGVCFQMQFCPPCHLTGTFPLPLDMGYLLVWSNFLLLMVIQQQVVILEFSHKKMSTCPPTLPLNLKLQGEWAYQYLDFSSAKLIWTSEPRAVREYMCVVLNHQVCNNLLQQPQKTNTYLQHFLFLLPLFAQSIPSLSQTHPIWKPLGSELFWKKPSVGLIDISKIMLPYGLYG